MSAARTSATFRDSNRAWPRQTLGDNACCAPSFPWLRCLFFLAIASLGLLGSTAFGAVPADSTNIKVVSRHDGESTRVIVENSELSEVTMTFCFSGTNLKASVDFPHTATFKPGETEAFHLTPLNPGLPWEFGYTNYFKLGSSEAVHDDSCVYLLPYQGGRAFRVTQGYNGKFSHTGANQYAIDWMMPEGTPVSAARSGLVVKVKDDSDEGGDSLKFDRCNNFVIIRHSDGTLGQYCHLQKNGAKVVPGQRVQAGEIIALSGNTGFSSGAHLHFCVFKTRSGKERVSIPVKFKQANGEAITLVEGRKYRAYELQNARAASIKPAGPRALLQ